MKIKDLKTAILPGTPATAENKERAYAQLVQFLDSKSLNLVMHDAKDDGRKALEILRRHYAGTGKQRIISMYTTLCSLTKLPNEDLTDYIIKCEQTATQLRSAGKVIEDSLLRDEVVSLDIDVKDIVVRNISTFVIKEAHVSLESLRLDLELEVSKLRVRLRVRLL